MFEIEFLVCPRKRARGYGLPAALVKVSADFVDNGLEFLVGKEALDHHVPLILEVPDLALVESKFQCALRHRKLLKKRT
jgi:hypothetical protein